MRLMLKTAVAALALASAWSGAAYAQDNNCPVTTSTSTGPNGETITRREACGAVEITTTAPPTSNRPTSTPPANRPTTSTPPASRPSTPASGGGNAGAPPTTSVMTIPGRSNTPTPNSFPGPSNGMSSSPPQAGGGWTPPTGADAMAMQRPVARIVLYDNNTFRGRNIGITQNTPNLARRRFADVASAARSQGGVWELCSEPDYGGTCVTTDADLDLDAAGIGNTVASVRLVR